MRKLIAAILLLMLVAFSLSACSSEDVIKVKSSEDAQQAIADVSTQVEDVSATLDSLNKNLG